MSTRKLKALEREQKSLELRMSGATYQQIGDALGIKKQSAYGAVMRALTKLNTKILENADQVKAMELQRLDKLYLAMYKRAITGDYGAVDRCLKIMERRAKYQGLDAPINANLNVETQIKAYIGISPEDWDKDE